MGSTIINNGSAYARISVAHLFLPRQAKIHFQQPDTTLWTHNICLKKTWRTICLHSQIHVLVNSAGIQSQYCTSNSNVIEICEGQFFFSQTSPKTWGPGQPMPILNLYSYHWLGLELMPFGWAPTGQVMTSLWGEGGLKAMAQRSRTLGQPHQFLLF